MFWGGGGALTTRSDPSSGREGRIVRGGVGDRRSWRSWSGRVPGRRTAASSLPSGSSSFSTTSASQTGSGVGGSARSGTNSSTSSSRAGPLDVFTRPVTPRPALSVTPRPELSTGPSPPFWRADLDTTFPGFQYLPPRTLGDPPGWLRTGNISTLDQDCGGDVVGTAWGASARR